MQVCLNTRDGGCMPQNVRTGSEPDQKVEGII